MSGRASPVNLDDTSTPKEGETPLAKAPEPIQSSGGSEVPPSPPKSPSKAKTPEVEVKPTGVPPTTVIPLDDKPRVDDPGPEKAEVEAFKSLQDLVSSTSFEQLFNGKLSSDCTKFKVTLNEQKGIHKYIPLKEIGFTPPTQVSDFKARLAILRRVNDFVLMKSRGEALVSKPVNYSTYLPTNIQWMIPPTGEEPSRAAASIVDLERIIKARNYVYKQNICNVLSAIQLLLPEATLKGRIQLNRLLSKIVTQINSGFDWNVHVSIKHEIPISHFSKVPGEIKAHILQSRNWYNCFTTGLKSDKDDDLASSFNELYEELQAITFSQANNALEPKDVNAIAINLAHIVKGGAKTKDEAISTIPTLVKQQIAKNSAIAIGENAAEELNKANEALSLMHTFIHEMTDGTDHEMAKNLPLFMKLGKFKERMNLLVKTVEANALLPPGSPSALAGPRNTFGPTTPSTVTPHGSQAGGVVPPPPAQGPQMDNPRPDLDERGVLAHSWHFVKDVLWSSDYSWYTNLIGLPVTIPIVIISVIYVAVKVTISWCWYGIKKLISLVRGGE